MLMSGSSRSSRTRSWLGRVMGQSWTPRRSRVDSFFEDCCFRRQVRSSVPLWRLESFSYVISDYLSFIFCAVAANACLCINPLFYSICLLSNSSWRILTPVFVTTCGLSKRQVFARTASLSINVERVEIVASDANSAVQPRSDDYCLDRSLIFLYMSQTAEQCLEPPCFPLSHQYEFYNS